MRLTPKDYTGHGLSLKILHKNGLKFSPIHISFDNPLEEFVVYRKFYKS